MQKEARIKLCGEQRRVNTGWKQLSESINTAKAMPGIVTNERQNNYVSYFCLLSAQTFLVFLFKNK